MQAVAERCFAQLLLARFLLLNLLIEDARKAPGGLHEKNHRRLWVLLQAQPTRVFDSTKDIFTSLAGVSLHYRVKHSIDLTP